MPAARIRQRGVGAYNRQMSEASPAPPNSDEQHSHEVRRPDVVVQPSRRRIAMTVLLLAHPLGIAAIAFGEWPSGVALIVASHMLLVWGTLLPGSALLSPLLSRLRTSRRQVWLTIDDGPSADTLPILDLLDAHDAKATFFLIGEHAAAQPALVAEIGRRGHGIGNHTASHPAAWFWALGPAKIRRQIGDAQRTLTELSGSPPTFFRAVVGMANVFVAAELERQGLTRVGWTARGFDSVIANPAAVWAQLHRKVRPGAIVLLHEGAAHGKNVAIVAHALQQLDRHGYRCVLPEIGMVAVVSQPSLPGPTTQSAHSR
jgi:peptidoglycan/xylan/chitin deacetylase (PgdA/CDA1 family)